MPVSRITTKNAPAPIGPYSQSVVSEGKLVFTAGQIAIDPSTGQLVDGDIKMQTRRVLQNVEAILVASGASMKSVVKTTVFLKDMGEFGPMNEVYAEFLSAAAPARSTVAPASRTARAAARICGSLSTEQGPAMTTTSSPPTLRPPGRRTVVASGCHSRETCLYGCVTWMIS